MRRADKGGAPVASRGVAPLARPAPCPQRSATPRRVAEFRRNLIRCRSSTIRTGTWSRSPKTAIALRRRSVHGGADRRISSARTAFRGRRRRRGRPELCSQHEQRRLRPRHRPAPNLYVGGTFGVQRHAAQPRHTDRRRRRHCAVHAARTATSARPRWPAGRSTPAAGSPQIGGQARNRVAGLDFASGRPTIRSDSNGDVARAAAAGPVVYAGGQFTQIGGRGARFRAVPRPPATTRRRWRRPAGPRGARTGARADSLAPRLGAVSLGLAAVPRRPPGRTPSPAGPARYDAALHVGGRRRRARRPTAAARPARGRRACVTPARAPRGATLHAAERVARSPAGRGGRNAVSFSGRLPAVRCGPAFRFRLSVGDALGDRSGARTISFSRGSPAAVAGVARGAFRDLHNRGAEI